MAPGTDPAATGVRMRRAIRRSLPAIPLAIAMLAIFAGSGGAPTVTATATATATKTVAATGTCGSATFDWASFSASGSGNGGLNVGDRVHARQRRHSRHPRHRVILREHVLADSPDPERRWRCDGIVVVDLGRDARRHRQLRVDEPNDRKLSGSRDSARENARSQDGGDGGDRSG
jgi:hypothetical protein